MRITYSQRLLIALLNIDTDLLDNPKSRSFSQVSSINTFDFSIPHIFQTKFKKVKHATPRNK